MLVGGTGVFVGGTGVFVGGTGVFVFTGVVGVAVSVGTEVADMLVAVGVGVIVRVDVGVLV